MYSEVPLTEDLQEKLGLEKITVKKGYVVVGTEQGENLYLGERSRMSETIQTYEHSELAAAMNFSSLLGGRTVAKTVDKGWSADFDKTQNLGIKIFKTVRVDDFVSKQ